MKRLTGLMALVCLIAVCLTACGAPKNKPEDVVAKFSEAMKSWDLDAMNSCMSDPEASDFTAMKLDVDDALGQEMVDAISAEASKITYEIEDVKIEGKEAIVKVKYTYSDFTPVFTDMFERYIEKVVEAVLAGLSDDEIDRLLSESFQESVAEAERELVDIEVSYECVLVKNEWFIWDTLEDSDADNVLKIFTCNMEEAMAEAEKILE